MQITIRRAGEDDAAAVLALGRALDSETQFMMHEPGERTTTVEEQRKRIHAMTVSGNGAIFLALNDADEMVGLLGAQGGAYRRNRRTVHIFIGILQAYTGHGIGRRLFETMEAWARAWGAHRLELSVMAHNERAIGLYRKMGFTVEGRMRDTLYVGGQYIDEFIMAKILEENE